MRHARSHACMVHGLGTGCEPSRLEIRAVLTGGKAKPCIRQSAHKYASVLTTAHISNFLQLGYAMSSLHSLASPAQGTCIQPQ